MNRRKFLKWIGLGATTATIAPTILIDTPEFEMLSLPMLPAEASEWCTYIDPIIHRTAIELAYKAGQSISAIYEATF